MTRKLAVPGTLLALAAAGALYAGGAAVAQPPAPDVFCEVYPDAPTCAGGSPPCSTCHQTPPALNVYGAAVSAELLPGEPRPLAAARFEEGLPDALRAVEDGDADGDGVSNRTEIDGGSAPSSAASIPTSGPCEDEDDDGWELCGYDAAYAFKKVMIDFCGRQPTLGEREAFADEKHPKSALHATLDRCVESEHWRGIRGRVWNLANRKILPVQAVKTGKDSGPIPLADYDDDYAFFVWTQTGDRDARDVLLGQYFVSATYEDGATVYERWQRDPDEDLELRGYERYQAVEKERRAGLLTHRWFLMRNTMFTAVPRTTAAQAYRAFLGYDLAKLEGLQPVDGEPVDYDLRGVGADGCVVCHATLDPLTYPFSRYEGIGGGNANAYSYGEDRMLGFEPTEGPQIVDTPEAGVLFGQPVADLVEWAEVAANSEAFRRATVLDYWKLLVGEPPRPDEQAEFGRLVEELGDVHGYRIEAMLHDLVDTRAYGAP